MASDEPGSNIMHSGRQSSTLKRHHPLATDISCNDESDDASRGYEESRQCRRRMMLMAPVRLLLPPGKKPRQRAFAAALTLVLMLLSWNKRRLMIEKDDELNANISSSDAFRYLDHIPGEQTRAFGGAIDQEHVDTTIAGDDVGEVGVIYLNSTLARGMLKSGTGTISGHYRAYESFFDGQINKAYCAVATAAAILNSLRLLRRGDGIRGNADVQRLHQKDLLTSCTQGRVVDHHGGGEDGAGKWGIDGILSPPYGLSLTQLASFLECHLSAPSGDSPGNINNVASSWTVSATAVNPAKFTVETVRLALIDALSDDHARVAVNYSRKAVGQLGVGHISPVAAYNGDRDSFLVMDVSRDRYPPAWISASDLFSAISTVDTCGVWDWPTAQEKLKPGSGLRRPETEEQWAEVYNMLGCRDEFRGYLIVRKKERKLNSWE